MVFLMKNMPCFRKALFTRSLTKGEAYYIIELLYTSAWEVFFIYAG